MGHDHSHQVDNSSKNIALGFILNLLFACAELIGGFYTNSVAILADALHDFGDALALAVSWYLQKLSTKPRDATYSYGYKRYSVLGSLVISIVLTVGSLVILAESIQRLLEPKTVNATGMLYFAIAGILVNCFAAMRIRRGTSLNEKVVSLHFIEDVLGWVAVLLGSIVMLFFPWPWLDSIISIGIALWVLFNVYKNLNTVSRVFLQGTPPDLDIAHLLAELEKTPGVISIHDLHVWSLDGMRHIMTLHAVLRTKATLKDRAETKIALREIASKHHITHATIEIEMETEGCCMGLIAESIIRPDSWSTMTKKDRT